MKNIKTLKVFLKNFGCKTNFSDLFSLMGRISLFETVEISDDLGSADVVVLNSCSVTKDAERELLKWVRRCKSAGKKVVVSGCMPNISLDKIREAGADSILGAGVYSVENVKRAIEEKEFVSKPRKISDFSSSLEDDVSYFIRSFELFPRHRVYLKIQEGCDRFCTFCSIPKTRGLPRFLSAGKVIDSIKLLRDKGVREVVLVGTHLALYGKNGKSRSESFGTLVKKIAKEFGGSRDIRIRFASLSPGEIDDDFLEGLELGGSLFCPHFHLSVQSGSARILRTMRRWHTFDDFLHDSEKLLSIFPTACIGTDVILGFPGETEKDFEETLSNFRSAPLGHIHVFPFSPRPGTPAYFMKPVPSAEVKRRTEVMLELAREKRERFILSFISKEVSVLVERKKDGEARGTSENYITCIIRERGVRKTEKEIKEGDVITVRIESVFEEGRGRFVALAEAI